MTNRLKELEAEITSLKALQAKLEKDMGVSPDPTKEDSPMETTLPGSKEEIDSRSVYVSGVHHACTPEEVQQHFESCGTVNRVTIKTDKTGQPKGFAYVEFLEREAMRQALETLNESELHGRQLKVCAKRTNIPGMKKRSIHPRGGFNPYLGSSYPVRGAVPYIPPYFTSPYGYAKAPPRFRRAVRRFSPYYC